MEKINLVELLKDCPQGMELDCTNYDGVISLKGITNDKVYPIEIHVVYGNECNTHTLTKYGQTINTPYNKCIIFPKGKSTWEGFHRPFNPGDIVITDHNKHAFIYLGENDNYWECYCGVYCGTRNLCINSKQWSDKKHSIRLATEEEIEKLFQVIKDNGYKWNAETKTLEKIKPKFKPGDKIRSKNKKDEYFYILYVDEDKYKYILNIKGYCLEFKDQDNYELVSDTSIEPKFKVGDKVRYKNNHNVVFTITSIEEDTYVCGAKAAFWFADQDDYELVPNKFDINTLKPFDKVLIRDNDKECWDITFYECYDSKNKSYPYRTLGGTVYKQCIPYKGNEDLIGLVKDCDDYYKT